MSDAYQPLAVGKNAEEIACQHLETQKLRLVAKNFRCKLGEIDLIMMDKDTLVFVEVRLRNNTGYGDGAQTVTATKQRKLRNTAKLYLQTHFGNRPPPCRFDVVSIAIERGKPQIDWIKDAFC